MTLRARRADIVSQHDDLKDVRLFSKNTSRWRLTGFVKYDWVEFFGVVEEGKEEAYFGNGVVCTTY
jgi:hypothetical protein